MIARREGCHARAGKVSNTVLALIQPFDLTAGKVCSLLTTHMTCDSVYRYDLSWSTTMSQATSWSTAICYMPVCTADLLACTACKLGVPLLRV